MAEITDLSNHSLRNTVSDRARNVFAFNFLYQQIQKCKSDPYEETTNPDGYVSMGSAVNSLCEDLIEERLRASDVFKYSKSNQHYFSFYGLPSAREAVAQFLTDYLRSHQPVNPDNIVICSGVAGAIDCLAHVIAEPGDCFLCASPVYPGIRFAARTKSLVTLKHVPLTSQVSHGEKPFELTADKVEKAILKAKHQTKRVKGVILLNPNNPLGTVLAPDTLMDILNVCKKYSLHVISDEVYALSLINDQVTFTSVLALPELPDPMRTHLLYGLSKDFGLAGLRFGIFHTLNPVVLRAMQVEQDLSSLPSVVHDTVATLLQDREWINTKYLPTNQRLLRECYDVVKRRLASMGVPFLPVDAGIFVFVDLRKHLKEQTFEAETDLFHKLMDDAKLYILPGSEQSCSEPGWFRIVFSMPPNILHKGFDRLENFLKKLST